MGFFTKKYSTGADRLAAAKKHLDNLNGKKAVDLYKGLDENELSPEEKYILAQANYMHWYYHSSRKTEVFLDASLRLHEKAAEAAYIPSMLELAKYYTPESEERLKKNKERLDPEKTKKAVHWYEAALNAGCEDEEIRGKYKEVAEQLENDMDEHPRDYFQGEALQQRIREAIQRKEDKAERMLQDAENLLEEGDKEKAAELYDKIVDMGGERIPDYLKPVVGKAAYRMFQMARDNSVNSVGEYKQVFYMNRAYSTHTPEGHLALGDYHRTHTGESCTDCYQKAAEAGRREAYFWYGLCCYYGFDMRVDYAQAAKYLMLVCDEEPRAAYLCSVLYKKGRGVKADLDLAEKLYAMAASKGWDRDYNEAFEIDMKANYEKAIYNKMIAKELGTKTRLLDKDGRHVVFSIYGYAYPVRD